MRIAFKNGILPIKLNQSEVDYLMNEAENKKKLFINLENQIIVDENEKATNFEVDPFRKKCLLEGLDDIALTLKKDKQIESFEAKIHNLHPWIV